MHQVQQKKAGPTFSVALPSASTCLAGAFFAVTSLTAWAGSAAPDANPASVPVPLPAGSIKITVNQTGEKRVAPNDKNDSDQLKPYGYLPNTPGANDQNTIIVLGSRLHDERLLTYTITLQNNAKIPAENLAVEYHFYSLSREKKNYANFPPETTDISAIKQVDLAPKQSANLLEGHILKAYNSISFKPSILWYLSWIQINATATGQLSALPKKQLDEPILELSTQTSLIGYQVTVRQGKTVIAQLHEPDNLDEKLTALRKERLSLVNNWLSKLCSEPHLKLSGQGQGKPQTTAAADSPVKSSPTPPAAEEDAAETPIALDAGTMPATPAPAITDLPPGPPLPKGTVMIQVEKTDVNFIPVPEHPPGITGGEADIIYTITLTNSFTAPVNNVEVEWHFYNFSKTTKIVPGKLTNGSYHDEISSISRVDLGPKIKTVITTPPIPKILWKQKISLPSLMTALQTDLLGWRVLVRYNGAVIAHAEDPMDLKEKLAALEKEDAKKNTPAK